jgi:hypothetical protein
MSMIKHQQDVYKWSVVYLGANQDAIKTSARLGVYGGNAMSYAATSRGTMDAYLNISSNTSSLRSSGVGQTKSFFNQTQMTPLPDPSSIGVPSKIDPLGPRTSDVKP